MLKSGLVLADLPGNTLSVLSSLIASDVRAQCISSASHWLSVYVPAT